MNDGGGLLCLETATPTARVAVVDAGGVVRAAAEATAERHSANVLRLCDEVLRQAGLRPSDLAAIGCGAGPGSFTGLRVGLSVAKGLALAYGTPLVLVSSLGALRLDIAAAHPGARGVPCIDAGKGEVYASLQADATEATEATEEPLRLGPGELAARLGDAGPCVVAGNGADRFAAVLDAALPPNAHRASVPGPTAASVGQLALVRFRAGDFADLASAVPFYGRPPDITSPKR
jgi:tRNA threonylcarbamoyladenosine biosynthesis protein TsaB